MNDRRNFVKKKAIEKGRPKCPKDTEKFHKEVMVWSIVSAKDTGGLKIVNMTLYQDGYLKIIDERLVPQNRDWFPDNDCVSMHDGAPCNTAK